jgi:hypothetical protein
MDGWMEWMDDESRIQETKMRKMSIETRVGMRG